MSVFNEKITSIKDGLKSLLPEGAEKDTADKVAAIDKLVDEAVAENKKTAEAYDALKTDYINVIKNTSFKVKGDPQADDVGDNTDKGKSFEECLSEILAERKKK